MTEHVPHLDQGHRINDNGGKWLGWFAIIAAVIGLIWEPIWMGTLAIVLAAIGLLSPQKTLNGFGIALGILALIVGFI